MIEIMHLMAAPLVACLIIGCLHCYVGLQVVKREILFVDLALAQVAALGTAFAILLGMEPDAMSAYWVSLGFAFFGSVIFSVCSVKDGTVPQEAIIGIVYVVSAALAILVLDHSPHGAEEMKSILVGSILFADWQQVFHIFIVYGCLGIIHFKFRRQFLMITFSPEQALGEKISIRLWDFFFYALFAVMVTQSVKIAGVLLVFCFLIIPAVGAMLFFKNIRNQLFLGWGISFIASLLGLFASANWDLPTGASVVASFGIILILLAFFRWFVRR